MFQSDECPNVTERISSTDTTHDVSGGVPDRTASADSVPVGHWGKKKKKKKKTRQGFEPQPSECKSGIIPLDNLRRLRFCGFKHISRGQKSYTRP